MMYLDMTAYWISTCREFLDMLVGYDVDEAWKEEEIYPDIMERLFKAQEMLEKIRIE